MLHLELCRTLISERERALRELARRRRIGVRRQPPAALIPRPRPACEAH
jgi:hypothetical protein